jgi:hypothetical protein
MVTTVVNIVKLFFHITNDVDILAGANHSTFMVYHSKKYCGKVFNIYVTRWYITKW